MKVVILAGGLGTRLGEETGIRPKPMVEIGGFPILWHIMKMFDHYGYNDFIILCGYKGEIIKDYFDHYEMRMSDVEIDFATGTRRVIRPCAERWKVTLLDTGKNTMTGGRILQTRELVGDDTFMLAYGDGVSDINLNALVAEHRKSGCYATLATIQPEGRFGMVKIGQDGFASNFQEKPRRDEYWISAGFFALEPAIFDYIPNRADASWEQGPLQQLSHERQLNAYRHMGFWRPMDMLKDKLDLNAMWDAGNAPWKVWN